MSSFDAKSTRKIKISYQIQKISAVCLKPARTICQFIKKPANSVLRNISARHVHSATTCIIITRTCFSICWYWRYVKWNCGLSADRDVTNPAHRAGATVSWCRRLLMAMRRLGDQESVRARAHYFGVVVIINGDEHGLTQAASISRLCVATEVPSAAKRPEINSHSWPFNNYITHIISSDSSMLSRK